MGKFNSKVEQLGSLLERVVFKVRGSTVFTKLSTVAESDEEV
jgi:hypothetical protein